MRLDDDDTPSNLYALYAEWSGNLTPRSRATVAAATSEQLAGNSESFSRPTPGQTYRGAASRAPAICVSWAPRARPSRVKRGVKNLSRGVDTQNHRERIDYVTRFPCEQVTPGIVILLSVDLISRGWLRMSLIRTAEVCEGSPGTRKELDCGVCCRKCIV